MSKARDSLAHGSPLAALWIYRQLQETRHASLREVFQAEIQLATNIVRHPEFAEGVRALLIDKDRNPAWQYRLPGCAADVLDAFFTRPGIKTPWRTCNRLAEKDHGKCSVYRPWQYGRPHGHQPGEGGTSGHGV